MQVCAIARLKTRADHGIEDQGAEPEFNPGSFQ
jgi:hypothetical protein